MMETLSEETEDGVVPPLAASTAADGDKKQMTKNNGGGNFRVNMNVIVRVRPLQVRIFINQCTVS